MENQDKSNQANNANGAEPVQTHLNAFFSDLEEAKRERTAIDARIESLENEIRSRGGVVPGEEDEDRSDDSEATDEPTDPSADVPTGSDEAPAQDPADEDGDGVPEGRPTDPADEPRGDQDPTPAPTLNDLRPEGALAPENNSEDRRDDGAAKNETTEPSSDVPAGQFNAGDEGNDGTPAGTPPADDTVQNPQTQN